MLYILETFETGMARCLQHCFFQLFTQSRTGPQIAPRAKWGRIKQPKPALLRWRNNGGTGTLLEKAFTS